MQELRGYYPDVETLLALSQEELGAKILYLLRIRQENNPANSAGFRPEALTAELAGDTPDLRAYVGNKGELAALAVAEAWAWLEGQALVVPTPGDNGARGWRVLSRRAHEFEDSGVVQRLAGTRLLNKDALHPTIAAKAWLHFIRGDYEVAVSQAMKQVEIALREATGLGGDLPAVQLARRVFHDDNGMLTDPAAEISERQAMAHLFAGTLGVLKNPHSHRNVDVEDAADAASLIMFASYLVKIIEARHRAFILS
jgi:uncharacterized protein (TIGR02391 family)